MAKYNFHLNYEIAMFKLNCALVGADTNFDGLYSLTKVIEEVKEKEWFADRVELLTSESVYKYDTTAKTYKESKTYVGDKMLGALEEHLTHLNKMMKSHINDNVLEYAIKDKEIILA